MKKTLLLTVLGTLALTVPASAILGLGDIVYDPSNFEEAVQQLAQMAQQYAQLVRTYDMVTNQYQQMLRNAQPLSDQSLGSYRTLATRWALSYAADQYGNTADWTNGVNGTGNMANGYATATQSLNTYGNAFSNIPADQIPNVKTSYATVELTDGANLSALQTIAALRANAQAFDTAIGSLENDSLSADPNMNTEMAVLNKINAAGVMALHTSQDANRLLAALTESQVIASKGTRDAEARAINQHISFVQNAQAVMAAQSENASGAMLAWRMP